MTVMRSISKLTTSVDQLTGAANLTKAQLDAKVATAQAEVPAAQAEQSATEAARDAAGTNATDAETHLATVKAGVTYAGIDAILAAKAVTAVDLFVYDTSLDSDGGAWRKRCQHTSWYNEPLNTADRGSRREFPAVAVIVMTETKLTVYDGDDPALPMWREMILPRPMTPGYAIGDKLTIGAQNLCTSSKNGIIALGQNERNSSYGAGISQFDLLADYILQIQGGRAFIGRNIVESWGGWAAEDLGSIPQIVNGDVNDVAMTVLPDAPVDPATGLPMPTIAVAASGGVSVIKDDGSVVDSSDNGDFYHCNISNGFFYSARGSTPTLLYVAPLAALKSNNFYPQSVRYRRFSDGSLYPNRSILAKADSSINMAGIAAGSSLGLTFLGPNQTLMADSLTCFASSTYNTGWMPGDIKGAFLSDTDDTDLVEAQLLANGSFETDLSSWTVNQATAWVSGAMRIESDGNPDPNSYSEIISVRPGAIYEIEMILSNPDTDPRRSYIRLSTNGAPSGAIDPYFGGAGQRVTAGTTVTRKTLTQVPAGVTSVMVSASNSVSAGKAGARIDVLDLAVREVVADRSVGNGSLTVNGAITRAPVATGAGLIAYSGFSAANYLHGAPRDDLNFGAGDFCLMGWVRVPAGLLGVTGVAM